MPNDALQKQAVKPPKASRGLSSFFQPAINTVAGMDPTGVLLQLLGKGPVGPMEPPPTTMPDDYGFIPPTPQLDDPTTQMMNRQNKIKSTFGKIPGR